MPCLFRRIRASMGDLFLPVPNRQAVTMRMTYHADRTIGKRLMSDMLQLVVGWGNSTTRMSDMLQLVVRLGKLNCRFGVVALVDCSQTNDKLKHIGHQNVLANRGWPLD